MCIKESNNKQIKEGEGGGREGEGGGGRGEGGGREGGRGKGEQRFSPWAP